MPTPPSSLPTRRRFLRLLGVGFGATLSLVSTASLAAAQATPTPTPKPPASPTPVPTRPPSPTVVPTPPPPQPRWLQALYPVDLWSGPDDKAISFGKAAQWDYFQWLQPQTGPRLLVHVERTNNYAWVDAVAVGPSGPPPPGWPPAEEPPPQKPVEVQYGWLAPFVETGLWADATGTVLLGTLAPFTPLKQTAAQSGPRIAVADPYTKAPAYVEAASVGPVGEPQHIGVPPRWWGRIAVDGANLRAEPTTQSPVVGQVGLNSPLVVSAWVGGEEASSDNPTWAKLGEGVYAHSSVLRPVALPATPPPPAEAAGESGRWLDLNLTHQVVVAYEGQTPVHAARTSTGRPTWETPAGRFYVQRRVEKETMESSSLLGLDAQRADYKVENVRWSQYITADGIAFHENYWKARDTFGIPSSHGCPGLIAEDAFFLWQFTQIGTPVYSHY